MKSDALACYVDADLQTSVTEGISETALSYGQQALCFLHASDPSSPVYNVSFAIRIYSILDVVVTERVLQKIVERHPAFRTTFPFINGTWVQKIQQHKKISFQEIDISGLSEENISNRVQAVYKQPFDLENGPLFRAHLLRKAKDDAILLLVAHHIVCDGWSIGVLISDLKKLFEAEFSGEQAVLQSLDIDYTTYVQHQQEILASSKGEELREYWQEKLAGDLPVLNLPLSYPRPPLQTFNGATYHLDWPDTFSQQIRDFGTRERVSPFIVLLSGFYVLLHRYSGQQDLIVGTPFSGRTNVRFNAVIGDFVNPLVLRAEVSELMSFRSLLTQTRRIVMEALTYQEYPFSVLVENLKIKRDLSRPPIFEVMVNYVQMPERGDKFVTGASGRERTYWGEMEVEPYNLKQQEGQLSLTFDTYEAGTSLSSVLTYNTDLFAPDLIERMGQDLKQTLLHILQQPDDTIAELPLLTAHDQQQLAQWNATTENFPVAPNPLEKKLLFIWQQVLDKTVPFGVTDNYFSLGGDKLNAGKLVTRLKHEFKTPLTLRDVFQKPTIRMMAKLLQSRLSVLATTSKPPTLSRLYLDDIPVVATQEYYLLSNAQQRLWALEQLEEAATAYTVPFALKLEGELKLEALQQALLALVQRHDALRTVFFAVDGEPRQKVQHDLPFNLNISDLRQYENQQQQLIMDEVQRPFSLLDGPLLRLHVLQLSDNASVVLFNIHHIVSDGISLGICVQELFSLYQAYHSNNPNNPLPTLPIQYKDYVAWQERLLVDESTQHARHYWHEKLDGELPVLELPTDFPRPKTQTYRGNMLHIPLDDALTQGLLKLAQQQNVTLFMLLLTLTKTLLYKYTGQKDIIVGSPVAGREHSDLQNQVGLYTNTLVLRNYLMAEDQFVEVLEQVKNTVTEAHEYQFYPFDRLLDELKLERDLSRSPLFDVMVTLQQSQNFQLQLEGIKATHYPIPHAASKFDLTFEFLESEGQSLRLLLEYNTDLFAKTTIKRIGSHLQCLLRKVLEQPRIRLCELNLLNTDEQKQILRQSSGPHLDFPVQQTLVELFEAQAQKTPQAVAVASERGELSYAALNRQANQLACQLRTRHNSYPDMCIGLMLNRTDRILVGILAILKTGAAYVPLDPTYPAKRIRYMLEDTQCSLIVSETEYVTQLLEYDLAQVVDLTDKAIYQNNDKRSTKKSEITDLTGMIDDVNPPLVASASSLAYVIYTSGSTGQPKGVMVEQQAVVNLVHAMQEKVYRHYDQPVREAFSATYTFDVSVQQIFATLLLGNTLVMLEQDVISDPRLLLQCLETQPIDIVDLTPGQFAALLDVGMVNSDQLKVRQITLGSETLAPDLVARFYERQSHSAIRLINMYGPTECCVDSTCHVLDALTFNPACSVPIGKPLANIQAYVLDHDYQPVPVGMEGEICIGGAGLARGYLNQAGLTASKFIPHLTQPDARLYTTGDRGRWLPDGNLEFKGRKDNQVKVRGFRIELGDIEQALLLHTKVKSAIVMIRTQQNHNELLAYAVMHDKVPMTELKRHLKSILPKHMIPAHIMKLESLPLNAIGKIDKKALPAPETAIQRTTCIMPRNTTEETLVLIWQDVLDKEVISINDNFFDLGGHSLNAVKVLLKVNQKLGTEVPLMALFKAPTIQQLAKTIQDIGRSTYKQVPAMCLNQTYSRHVFCLPPIFGYGIAYQSIAENIEGYSLHGLDWVGGESPIDVYVDAITKVQPSGEFRLLGYSAGGNLAVEVARELVRRGHNVVDIILLDSARLSEVSVLSETELDQQANLEFGHYATLLMGDESLKSLVDSSLFKSRMLQNIKGYLRYLASTVNTGGLESNIQVLRSTTQFDCDYGWQEVTNGKVNYHAGIGQHAQMLFGDSARQNAKILQQLMDAL